MCSNKDSDFGSDLDSDIENNDHNIDLMMMRVLSILLKILTRNSLSSFSSHKKYIGCVFVRISRAFGGRKFWSYFKKPQIHLLGARIYVLQYWHESTGVCN